MGDIVKGRNIKSKGIAVTHVDQGGPANGRSISLLMKSDLSPDVLSVDIIKSLRQVAVEMSMEEYLRKFFDLWYSDAQLLAKLLGFETELEYDAAENPDDAWLQDYNKRVQDELDDKLENITLLKAAKAGETLTLAQQYSLIKAQQQFEIGVRENNIVFEEADTSASVVIKAGNQAPATKTSMDKKEPPVDITKSQEYIDITKAMEELKAQNETLLAERTKAQDIIKAQEDLRRSQMILKATSFEFVEEAQRETVATLLMKSDSEFVLSLLEKAQEKITALNAEMVEVKKSFGETEHGIDGAVTTNDITDRQAILNANIEKAKKALSTAAV